MEADLRYPVGKFSPPATLTPEARTTAVEVIAQAPARLRASVAGLTNEQLDEPYRPGGWTVRQVVHHVADSHLNAYVRLRLALTEQRPTIRPYDESLWAELADARSLPVEVSLSLLESLHSRWVSLLKSLPPDAFERPYVHPETGEHTLNYLVAMYAWHSRHHVAHVTSLRQRMGWK
jgi:hypothetical protein